MPSLQPHSTRSTTLLMLPALPTPSICQISPFNKSFGRLFKCRFPTGSPLSLPGRRLACWEKKLVCCEISFTNVPLKFTNLVNHGPQTMRSDGVKTSSTKKILNIGQLSPEMQPMKLKVFTSNQVKLRIKSKTMPGKWSVTGMTMSIGPNKT